MTGRKINTTIRFCQSFLPSEDNLGRRHRSAQQRTSFRDRARDITRDSRIRAVRIQTALRSFGTVVFRQSRSASPAWRLVHQLARRKGLQDADAADLAQDVFRAGAKAID